MTSPEKKVLDITFKEIADKIIAAYKEHYHFPNEPQGESHMHDCIMSALEGAARPEGGAHDERTAQLIAAISVASIQNTRESAKQRIGRDNPFWTVAYDDVCKAVDREMDHRERAEKAWNAAIASVVKLLRSNADACGPGSAAEGQNWPFVLEMMGREVEKLRQSESPMNSNPQKP